MLGPALASAGLGGALLFSAAFAGKMDSGIPAAARTLPASSPTAAPLRGPGPFEGELIGQMSVPRLAMESPLFEGVGVATLARGAGHVPGTALPGEEDGRGLIAVPRGHWGMAVATLKLNDRVRIQTPRGSLAYRVVERKFFEPASFPGAAGGAGGLTLVTTYPADSAGPAPMRLAVSLEPITE